MQQGRNLERSFERQTLMGIFIIIEIILREMFIYLMNVLFNMLSHCDANLEVKQERRERKMYVYNILLAF